MITRVTGLFHKTICHISASKTANLNNSTLSELNHYLQAGCICHLQGFLPTMTKKLFIGNLPSGCTGMELEALLKKFGEVAECDVIANKNFGFVVCKNKSGQSLYRNIKGFLFFIISF